MKPCYKNKYFTIDDCAKYLSITNTEVIKLIISNKLKIYRKDRQALIIKSEADFILNK
jgi:excisionase family DNA binding protein